MKPIALDRLAQIVLGTLLHPPDPGAPHPGAPNQGLPNQGMPNHGTVDRVCTDSRGVSPGALFVALKGAHTDGHRFLREAFRNGATAALVDRDSISSASIDPSWPMIATDSPLQALQRLARWYRRQFFGRVVAITGSNGKTVVKDALGALLASLDATTSPGSYNSHLGLPLAVLSGEKESPLAVLEAGVSESGDMAVLEEIAAPDYGILTNIGMAHLASFGSRAAIAQEKMRLFRRIGPQGWVIVPAHEPTIAEAVDALQCVVHRIGGEDEALSLTPLATADDGQIVALSVPSGDRFEILIRTRSADIVHDLHIAALAAHLLGIGLREIATTLDGYSPLPTRAEVWSSSHGVRIINDAYTSDPISVHSALRTAALGAPQTGRKIFAFAGMRELGARDGLEHRQVGAHAADCGFSHLFLVGQAGLRDTEAGFLSVRPEGIVTHVDGAAELKDRLVPILRHGDTVLFKGPRNSGMVHAARDLAGSMAQRAFWLDLAAIGENVARFRRHCPGSTKIMAVLKALAYGTELVHLAFWMARLGIHHIGVSSTGEGVSTRKTGVTQDIYVFLPDRDDVDSLVRYRLTPIVYSADLVETFDKALSEAGQTIDVHLKVNTGMNRLGVDPREALGLARRIRQSRTMRLAGVCTHFSSADDPDQDDHTRRQIATFDQVVGQLRADGFDNLLVHAANTAGTVRFPEAHYDMVRVGLGLYGVYPSPATEQALPLALAVGVTSRIATIQHIEAGESLGYNRAYVARRAHRIGVVPFGYDDGLPWQRTASGTVLVDGQEAPILGRISMDQMQIDITDLPNVGVGSSVLLYGTHDGHVIRPELVADRAGTMAHELLVRLGKRVTRVYVEP